MTSLTDIADESFASLTTFRKTGVPVSTAVWIARDGDALVVTTSVDTGKVKRLRNNARVKLQPSGRSGAVKEGSPIVSGVAEIVTDQHRQDALRKPLAAKYGLQYKILVAIRGRKGRANSCILRITAD